MFKKKSLGQHFLNNPHYLRAVVDAAEIKQGDVVVEIGPGEGSLTSLILERGAKVLAVEKDARLIPVLKEKFADKSFELVEGDALEFEPSAYGLTPGTYKLVGNIPYYITGALFKKFLSSECQPSTLVFLIQKEVADRIVARDKKESILSLSVKAYGEAKIAAKVPRGAFSPPPNVDSAVLVVKNISRGNFKTKAHEERFFELVRTGFGQKRKLLASNLKNVLGENYSHIFENVGIPANARAEDVPLEQWIELSIRA